MATLQYSAEVKRAANEVWRRVSALDSAKHLTNMITDVDVTGSDTRVCSTADGGRIAERIVATDNELKRQAYTVTQSPFGLEHHNAAIQVVPIDGETCRLVWTIDLLPDALAEQMNPVLQGEFRTMVARLT